MNKKVLFILIGLFFLSTGCQNPVVPSNSSDSQQSQIGNQSSIGPNISSLSATNSSASSESYTNRIVSGKLPNDFLDLNVLSVSPNGAKMAGTVDNLGNFSINLTAGSNYTIVFFKISNNITNITATMKFTHTGNTLMSSFYLNTGSSNINLGNISITGKTATAENQLINLTVNADSVDINKDAIMDLYASIDNNSNNISDVVELALGTAGKIELGNIDFSSFTTNSLSGLSNYQVNIALNSNFSVYNSGSVYSNALAVVTLNPDYLDLVNSVGLTKAFSNILPKVGLDNALRGFIEGNNLVSSWSNLYSKVTMDNGMKTLINNFSDSALSMAWSNAVAEVAGNDFWSSLISNISPDLNSAVSSRKQDISTNTSWISFLSNKPDLVISMSLSTNLLSAGDSFTPSFSISNRGPSAANGNFTASLYITNILIESWLINNSGLNSGTGIAVPSKSFTMPGSISVGQQSLWVRVDSWYTVLESNEGNNNSLLSIQILPPKPNLTITSVTLYHADSQTNSLFSRGEVMYLDITVKNNSTAGITNSSYQMAGYFGSTKLFSIPVNTTNSTQSQKWTASFTIAPDMALGQTDITLKVDDLNQVVESDKSDNSSTKQVTIQ